MATTTPTHKTLQAILNSPQDALSPETARQTTADIMANKLTPTQISAFLVTLKLTGKEHDPQTIAAVVDAMREAAVAIDPPLSSSVPSQAVIDIVGTGGDGQNTFNVSTASSIVAAGAGCKVAKHGNRASSSSSGSADVLEALGCRLSAVTAPAIHTLLKDDRNFCFLFAQVFHPAMRHVAGPRKELGVRTIFNLLGPMINPARPSRMIVGVFSRDVGRIMAEALHLSGVQHGWVVHGCVGLDEISPEGETLVWEFGPSGVVSERTISPADFGLDAHPLKDVVGGDATENAATMRSLLDGSLTGPILDFVLLNAGALLHVAGVAADLKTGVALARESIASGSAKRQLALFAEATQQL
ncbi:glycosyl transferase family, a/b domain-containing protein [Entophlyctis helioformis]|nr:glycosyl transferase family, a/b domain-containing protein [Entophlyctis helioformis]